MSRPLQTIAPDVAADDAFEQMRRLGVRHLAVVGKDREVAGILSDRDLGGRRLGGRAGKTVADLMSAPAITAAPDTTVRRAANMLRGRNLGCLPVVDDRGKPVGMVTVSDLLELIGRGAFRPPLVGGQRPVLPARGPLMRKRSKE